MSRPPVTVPHRSHKGTVWTDVEEVHCKGWLPSNEKRVMVVCSSCSKRCHSSCEGGSPHTAGSQMFHCNSFRRPAFSINVWTSCPGEKHLSPNARERRCLLTEEWQLGCFLTENKSCRYMVRCITPILWKDRLPPDEEQQAVERGRCLSWSRFPVTEVCQAAS
ncbi:hypothetical protein GWK47_007870 [Chionoecetes opilio]|uniref:Uncharacterized protein n=1 Tax=Chionoecetes opilio TaxID=41210 RepID=A0A8J4Y873_CHIOP|nr:hypothetical protein GWK47_007870 [Chionoecetes opilio]